VRHLLQVRLFIAGENATEVIVSLSTTSIHVASCVLALQDMYKKDQQISLDWAVLRFDGWYIARPACHIDHPVAYPGVKKAVAAVNHAQGMMFMIRTLYARLTFDTSESVVFR
jgi:hypothetical protein